MLIKQKEIFDPSLKIQLQKYVYDIIGVIQDVHNELPQGMPEFLYQEALMIALEQSGIKGIKEYQHHPVFRGHVMDSYLKMDLMIPRERGNVIIECKAIENLSSKEYQQLFSYMLGTGFPIGMLVNFHAYPKVVIHKFYYDRSDNTITAF
ncbi:MAG: GxxExxY protein [Prevotellaceae bacterium]|nr:GxxExxY protein [Candidatus Minthosoma equi]